MKGSISLVLFLVVLTASTGFVKAELQFVLELFRHGARGPLGNYYDSDQQKDIAGELTPTGERQHFNLGAQLREEYGFFLPLQYNHSEIYVRSSDVNRTLMSAASQLQGMFPAGFGPKLPVNLSLNYTLPAFQNARSFVNSNEKRALPDGLQVLPIHSALTIGDVLLQSDQNCLNLKKLRNSFYAENNLTMKFLNKEFAQTYSMLSTAINYNLTTLDQIHTVESTFQCDLYNGRQIPNLPPQLYQNTSYMASLSWNYLYNQPDLLRALNTPFLNQLMAYMNPVVSSGGKHPEGLKWVMYSAHDTNVQLISAALNLTSVDCLLQQRYPHLVRSNKTFYNCESYPKFASNLIFELHSTENTNVCENGVCISPNTNFIRLRRDGRNMNLCDRNSTICSYEEFTSRIKAFIVDYDLVCNSLLKSAEADSDPEPAIQEPVDKLVSLVGSPQETDEDSSSPFFISAIVFQQLVIIAAGIIIYSLKNQIKKARDIEQRELSIQEISSE